jgi:TorA maturation chaperone TorD
MKEMMVRASLYRVAALAFAFPDDPGVDEVRAAAPVLAETLEQSGIDPDTVERGRALLHSWTSTTPEEMRRNYSGLFVGNRQCRLDEAEYDTSIFYRHQRIADIAGFYRAFGFEIAPDSHQRADFVGTELEFMRVLLLKQAYALENGWDEKALACRDAEGKFFREHLEWWIPSMCSALKGAGKCAFYTALGGFLESFIRSEASRYLQPA